MPYSSRLTASSSRSPLIGWWQLCLFTVVSTANQINGGWWLKLEGEVISRLCIRLRLAKYRRLMAKPVWIAHRPTPTKNHRLTSLVCIELFNLRFRFDFLSQVDQKPSHALDCKPTLETGTKADSLTRDLYAEMLWSQCILTVPNGWLRALKGWILCYPKSKQNCWGEKSVSFPW